MKRGARLIHKKFVMHGTRPLLCMYTVHISEDYLCYCVYILLAYEYSYRYDYSYSAYSVQRSVRPPVRKQSRTRTVPYLVLSILRASHWTSFCTTSIRTSVVLVPGVGRTVLYCTTCRYGSPHFRTGCVRNLFAMSSRCVRDLFGIPAFLPASLHDMHAGRQ